MPVVIKNYDIGSISLPKGVKIGPSRAQIVDDATWTELKKSGRVQSLLKAGTRRGLVVVTPEAFVAERRAATGGYDFLNSLTAGDALLYAKGIGDKKVLAEIGEVIKHQSVKHYIKTVLTPKKTTKAKKKTGK